MAALMVAVKAVSTAGLMVEQTDCLLAVSTAVMMVALLAVSTALIMASKLVV
jgi:hypothetical protein